MNTSLIIYSGIGVILLLALVGVSISSKSGAPKTKNGRQDRDLRHIWHLPQIKQAFSEIDFQYLRERGSPGLVKRFEKERRRLGLDYLAALRMDFERLQNIARLISVMSPKVAVAQELLGLRLRTEFALRYQMIYLRLLTGIAPVEAISNLSNVVSSLMVRMETVMRDLGERAALGAEFTSPFEG